MTTGIVALGKFAKMWKYPFNWDLSQDPTRIGWSHQTATGLRSEVLASHPILFAPILWRWAVITLALGHLGVKAQLVELHYKHCSVLQWGQAQCGRRWRWNPTPLSCPPLRPALHCLWYCPKSGACEKAGQGGGAHWGPHPLLRCDVHPTNAWS